LLYVPLTSILQRETANVYLVLMAWTVCIETLLSLILFASLVITCRLWILLARFVLMVIIAKVARPNLSLVLLDNTAVSKDHHHAHSALQATTLKKLHSIANQHHQDTIQITEC
jgi:hypothetical protein